MNKLSHLNHIPILDVYDPMGAKWKDKCAELEAVLRQYRDNANTRMVIGFDFDTGEYPVTSETISILCAENQRLKDTIKRTCITQAHEFHERSYPFASLGNWVRVEDINQALEKPE